LTAEARSLAAYVQVPLLGRLAGRRTLLWGLGVGPLATADGRELARAVVELCDLVSVRDEASRLALAELGVAADHLAAVEVVSDPAFLLAPASRERADQLVVAAGLDPQRPLLAVSLRSWPPQRPHERWLAAVAEGLGRHAAASGAQLLLLPFDTATTGDTAILRRAGELALAAGAVGVGQVARADAAELAALVARCDAALAMRYHAVLFALRAGTPVVGIEYDPKVGALLRERGLGGWSIAPSDWDGETIAARLAASSQERPRSSRPLADEQAAARRPARRARLLLAGGPPPRSHGEEFLASLALGQARSLEGARAELARLAAAHRELGARHEEAAVASRQRIEELDAAHAAEAAAHAAEAAARAADAEAFRRREAELLAARDATRAALADETAALADARAALTAAHRAVAEASAVAEGRWHELADATGRRDELARTLAGYEHSTAFRLVRALWRASGALAPAGSRRRALLAGSRPAPAPPAISASGPAAAPEREPARPAEPAARAAGPPPSAAQVRGELAEFARRHRGAALVAAFASGTQLVGSEGQRPMHLVRELAARGVPVVYGYWRWSTDEWCPQDRVAEGILQLPLDLLAATPSLLDGLGAGRRLLFLELPHPDLFTLLAHANATGWLTVYDVLDDWSEFYRVGQAIWYDEPFETHLLRGVDAVFAVNGALAERVRRLGRGEVEVNGNGVRPEIAAVDQVRPLARGEVTVGYFGHLTPAWFDWRLVAECARRRPTWRFHLVGYGGPDDGAALPDNVALLGKQPPAALAGFAANWDVAIVPFVPGALAAAADPIKVYEYLAMGLPVVVTGVTPPPGAEHLVQRVAGVDELLSALERAAALPRDADERRAFAASCTWQRRLDQLLESLAAGRQRVAEKLALCEAAP
jgi:polysaccharide pyruvyl transferase WcaK-like protein/glycosyltransferase involved in cell wall biosynthesis